MSQRSPITIPPAALEAGARFLFKDEFPEANITWDDLNAYEREAYRAYARAAFLAMIAAWEGMKLTPWWEFTTHKRRVDLVLPLPEKVDG